MNIQIPYHKNAVRLCASFSALTLSAGVCAQQSSEQPDEIFELSPFEVTAGEEGTYKVSDTLAGSRLRSEMKDIGASITHLTSDFLDDIGASDLSEMLAYLPSAEQETSSINETDFAGVFRAQRFRIRGLFSESIARNYHAGAVGEYMPPADSYNVGRTTLSAGANSILFGSANPAGLINTQTVKPILGEDSHKLVHRTDNYGTMRFEYHGNFSLIEDKLAVRFDLLEEDRELYLDPQWKDQTRMYGALKWKASEKTTLNANFEWMDFARNAPVSTIYKDRSDLWRANGMATVEIDGKANPTDAALGIRSYGNPNRINAILGSSDSGVPVSQNWKHHAVGNDSRWSVANRAGISNLDLYDPATNLGADWRIDDRSAWIGDISLEHRFTENLYGQLSYFAFEHEKDVFVGMGSNLFVDASSNIPGYGDNPNAGRYYIDSGRMRLQEFEYDASNLRATLSYDLDLEDSPEWIGRSQFALMAEKNVGHRFTNRNDLMNTDPDTMLNGNPLNANNRIRPIYYVNLDGSPSAVAGQPSDVRHLQPYLASNGLPGAEWVPTMAGLNIETKQNAYLAAAQSFWFDDRLVTTLGYRIDEQDVYDISSGWTKDERGYFTRYQDIEVERTENAGVSDVSEDSYSLGAVYHLIRGQGALDLFSLTFNTSTNFAPSTAQRNYQGETVEYSQGETEDIGIKAELYNGKLDFRLSYYQSSQKSARQSGSNNSFINAAYDQIWSALAVEVDPSFLDNELGQVSDTFDIDSKGIELVLNARPIDGLRVRSTLSYNDATNSNVNPSSRMYRAENDPMLRSQYGDIDVSGSETVSERLDRLDGDFARVLAQEGQAPIELRDWRFSLLATYDFREGAMKGFNLGGNLNYASNATIGWAQDENGLLDANLPFEGDSLLSTGLNFGYKKKFDNFDWRIQLNVRNVLDDDDPIAIRADEEVNTDNQPLNTIYRAVEPRSFILTNSFSF
ncbi:hypothetical protein [Pelagicoccus mobilis]|uniref:TonB-dependent receptor n=1 Tax=Pelagicoccus mobilis TaxID=415221 RepID=A0A934S071_9BACT|nr:hypothetical protein [Pelagicoccus mobilis]MBK1879896.1 hypothetical protein [Pelagicoccus mobilis]